MSGGGGQTVENAAKMPRADPLQQMLMNGVRSGAIPISTWLSMQQKDDTPTVIPEGGTMVNRAGKVLATGATKQPSMPGEIQGYEYAVKQGYAGSYEQWDRERKRAGASSTSVHLPKAEQAFDVETAKLDAKQLDGWRDQAEKAADAVNRVKAMRQATTSGVYSGSFAGDRTKMANFFHTFGAPGIDEKKLASSQEYEKHAKELVLSVLKAGVGNTNISNADLTFVNVTVPQLDTNPLARTRLLDYIEKRSQSQVDLYKKADSYARSKKGLGGFERPTVDMGNSGDLGDGFRIK